MKKLICGVVGLAAAVAFADVDDILINFSTKGPDTYLDGTAVKDGECYALVWSADGVFEGIAADGSAVGEGDKVAIIAPVAKDGHCPEILFEVKAANYAGGEFGVYLLDTRVTKNGVTTVGRKNLINAAGAVASSVSASTGAMGTIASTTGTAAGTAAVAPAGVNQPTVKAIKIADGLAYITIECKAGLPGQVAVSGATDLAKGFTVIEGSVAQGCGGEDASATGESATATGESATATTATLIRPATGTSGFFKVQGVAK